MRLWLCLLLFHSVTGRARSPQSSQAPTLEDELQAAAVADKAGDYATAAKHYQDFLDKVDPAKMKPQAISEKRDATRLKTLEITIPTTTKFLDAAQIVSGFCGKTGENFCRS